MMYTEDKKVRSKNGTGTWILYYKIQLLILKFHIISAHLTSFSSNAHPFVNFLAKIKIYIYFPNIFGIINFDRDFIRLQSLELLLKFIVSRYKFLYNVIYIFFNRWMCLTSDSTLLDRNQHDLNNVDVHCHLHILHFY